MLKLYDLNNPVTAYPLDVEYCITHKNDGYDTLEFELPIKHKYREYLVYEAKVKEQENLYIIKTLTVNQSNVKVGCALYLDDWKQAFTYEYRRTDVTMLDVLNEIKPGNWAISGDLPSNRTTIESSEGQAITNATPYIILPNVAKAFSRSFQFDTVHRILYVIDPNKQGDIGAYFTDELNLRSISHSGNTTDFITRLHCYGKKDEEGNPLTFADINGGKDYVENFTYTNKVIEGGWSDERYTIAENLLQAGNDKLKELSQPIESYECDIIDLERAKPIEYSFLEIKMFAMVWLVDRYLHTRIAHQIIEYQEYRGRADSYAKNKIILSTVKNTITTNVKTAMQTAQTAISAVQSVQSTLNDIYTQEEVNALISDAKSEIYNTVYDTTATEIKSAINKEIRRTEETYQTIPKMGSVVLTQSALSHQITSPYEDFYVSITPTDSFRAWVEIKDKLITIHAEAPMTIFYSIFKKGSEK